jgi:hypothetical protein
MRLIETGEAGGGCSNMWEAVLVLAIVGLAASRLADVVNEILSPVIPGTLGSMKLSGGRIVMWIVAAIFAVIVVNTVNYDPIAKIGMADGADSIWNIVMVILATDAADAFFRRRLLRN